MSHSLLAEALGEHVGGKGNQTGICASSMRGRKCLSQKWLQKELLIIPRLCHDVCAAMAVFPVGNAIGFILGKLCLVAPKT